MTAPSALFPISLGYLDLSGVAVEVKKNYSRAILGAGCLVRQNDRKKHYELANTAKSAHSDDCLNRQPFFRLSLSSFTPATAQTAEPMRDSATVIMYHRFGEGRYPSTNISMEMFQEHLALLTNGEYTILPLPKIVETLKSGQLLPDRTVGISIDDAYLSVYENAWPLLKAANLPFTIFVATSPVNRNLSGYMNWDQLRELKAAGVTVGSQTHTHPHMHALSVERVREEIDTSNQIFLNELGERPELFAYPYGEYSRFVIDAIKDAGFTAAFSKGHAFS